MTENNMIKTESEIDAIISAQAITDETFDKIICKIKHGISEIELAKEIDSLLLKNGAEGFAFETIVAFGVGASECHHVPTNKILEKNEMILLDFGAIKNGYCSDMSRTLFFGTPSEKFCNIYNIVYNAQCNAIKYIKAEMTSIEADAIAREYIKANGYEKEFLHTLGHGLGRQVHENPRLAKNSDVVLKENMVVTVEPGIYIEDFGGVRIEDMVVIKKDCTINLTNSPKRLIII